MSLKPTQPQSGILTACDRPKTLALLGLPDSDNKPATVYRFVLAEPNWSRRSQRRPPGGRMPEPSLLHKWAERPFFVLEPPIAFPLETVRFERTGFTEKFGVIRLVEHSLELDAPWVAGRPLSVRVDQNWNSAVDRFRDFRVTLRTEDRAGSRIRIQQADVVGGWRNVPSPVFQLFDVMGKKDEIGSGSRGLLTRKIEDAELEGRMNVWKEDFLLSKSYRRTSRFDSATAAKKSLVVMSDAIPEGTSNPTRPCGATSR